jgi:hypothetical protein
MGQIRTARRSRRRATATGGTRGRSPTTAPGPPLRGFPITLAGGTGAGWIRSTEELGEGTPRATHPHLGSRAVTRATTSAPPEPL